MSSRIPNENRASAKETVIGIANSLAAAERIVDEAGRAGFARNDLSALFPDPAATRDFAHEQHTKAPEGAVTGGSAGGVIGGALGLLAGIGALGIPGLGPFIAAGPIMATLSGAAAGIAVGGIGGALIGMGIPEIEAKQYEGRLRQGSVLLSIHVETDEARERAKKLFERHGVKDVVTTKEQSVPDERRSATMAVPRS